MKSYRRDEAQGGLEAWPFPEDGPSEYRIVRGNPQGLRTPRPRDRR